MTEIINVFTKLVEQYGLDVAIGMIVVASIVYGTFSLLKKYSSIIIKYLENTLEEKHKKHEHATLHRKNVTPKIRAKLYELAGEIKADRALVFEFSNGSCNLVGLPFLYLSATCEVTTPGTFPVSINYQKVNTSLVADFLEKLEEKGYFYCKDIEEIKTAFPILYSFMSPNQVKSALFYSLWGITENTIGFMVITTVNNHTFTREDALPKTAAAAQIISSYLNFNELHDDDF